MMALFTNKRDCYGCGACASVCPRGAIKMVHDKHGFLYPVIDPEKCIDVIFVIVFVKLAMKLTS